MMGDEELHSSPGMILNQRQMYEKNLFPPLFYNYYYFQLLASVLQCAKKKTEEGAFLYILFNELISENGSQGMICPSELKHPHYLSS